MRPPPEPQGHPTPGDLPEPNDPQASAEKRKAENAATFDEWPPATEDAPPIAPEQQEPPEPAGNSVGIPQTAAFRHDGFDATMRLMLKYAAMPVAELVSATHTPTISIRDIETIGNFLK